MTPRLRPLRRVTVAALVATVLAAGAAVGLADAGERVAAKIAVGVGIGAAAGGGRGAIAYRKERRRNREMQ